MRSAAAPSGAGASGAGKGRVCGEVSRFGGRPFLRPGRSAVGRGGVGRVTDRCCFGADRYAARPLGSVLDSTFRISGGEAESLHAAVWRSGGDFDSVAGLPGHR